MNKISTMNAIDKILACGLLLLSTAMLNACDKNSAEPTQNQESQTVQNQANKEDSTVFEGCYSIDKTLPAQIKISQTNGQYVMQMKEPKGAATVWDKPESLENISIDKAWESFGVNAISLNKDDVESVIARPDGMMILAKVKQVSKNINPMLDSDFVVYIFKGSNTIYQVACDDKPIDLS